jgi:uncharacterized protein YlxW (UPF0749 family)
MSPTAPSGAEERGRPRGPASSMSLLTGLLTETLDPGYAQAAERREQLGTPRTGRPGRLSGASLTVLLGVAAIGLVLMVAAIQTHRAAPQTALERKQLISRIQAAESKATAQEKSLAEVRAELQAAQAAALGPSTTEGRQFAALSVSTGAVAATGPGVEVVVSDATSATKPSGGDIRQQGGPDLGRVQDMDLQHVVNGLWAAGAEAISINGQRLTSRSAIRTAGSAINVDFRPLSPPYTIDAIGDPKSLAARFQETSDGRYLLQLKSQFGIIYEMSTKDSLTLPAAAQLTVTDAVPVP